MINKTCKICGKEFYSKYCRKVYCSKECYYHSVLIISKEKSNLLKKLHNKLKCKECNKEFVQKNSNNRFCNNKCSLEYYRKVKNFSIIDNKTPYEKLLKLRFEILKRDNFQCKYCGRSPSKDNCKLQIDHIIPRNLNGTDEPSNLITSCQECNLGKSDILLSKRLLNKENMNNANF